MSRQSSRSEETSRRPQFSTAGTIYLSLATLGPIGRSRFAPGTVATVLVGIPAGLCIGMLSLLPAIIFTIIITVTSCYVADRAEKELGRHDPGEIVIDELAGYLVTMLGMELSLTSVILGFAAFRLFDIWKPWPICVLHRRLKGGFAVVMDDVGAGVYAHLLVWLLA